MKKNNNNESNRSNTPPKNLYVSSLWADTNNDTTSLEQRLDTLEQQVFEIKKSLKK
jgi:hypothetical protein